ncbi:bifunctional DNA primase/polymerase [Mycobacteroides abscessus subsp. abscessus]|uniref:bifunctional DNA primase/polymerase n=1 Tax=Mycobacteroides abscessus TaxID=36809 RepID=UPI001600B5C3|nr:bifunctional DNA primase/polymerase [Mycobacteroides abscessus]MBN7484546.1 bifunctional DNA primase/polymerase [Mycobacteroides abscessus subsp. abscessus]MDO3240512.1 bifunctional DNA primase/polymerase [Mycobacteroides abscessus subsp. abscessus]
MIHTDTLTAALDLAQRGFVPLFLAPLTKVSPVKGFIDSASRDPDAIRDAYDRVVSAGDWIESQRDSDFARFRDSAGTVTWSPALAAMRVTDYRAHDPNLALLLGASGVVLIDVDNPQEYRAWIEVCTANGFDPGPPTVRSPGVCTDNGEWVHRSGGHWWYLVPDRLRVAMSECASLTNAALTPTGFVTHNDKRAPAPAFMTNRRIGLVPPSIRREGPYRGSLDDIPPLPEFLTRFVEEHLEREQTKQRERALRVSTFAGHANDDRLIAWENTLSVTDVLEGWTVSGSDGECEVLEHPTASSPRSAVVHVPGCSHLDLDDNEHRLVTFWTPNVEGWITDALDDAGGSTVSLTKLVAFRDYDGDYRSMKRDLGLWTHTARPAPLERTTPRTATVLRTVRSGTPAPVPRNVSATPDRPARAGVTVLRTSRANPTVSPQRDSEAIIQAVTAAVEAELTARIGEITAHVKSQLAARVTYTPPVQTAPPA